MTEPTVAPLPKWASGISAMCGCMNGMVLAVTGLLAGVVFEDAGPVHKALADLLHQRITSVWVWKERCRFSRQRSACRRPTWFGWA